MYDSMPLSANALRFRLYVRLSRRLLLLQYLVNTSRNLDKTFAEYRLPLLITRLDSGGQRSRSRQAVEVLLGHRSLSSSLLTALNLC